MQGRVRYVLPTPVSVAVMKRPLVIFVGYVLACLSLIFIL